MTLYASKNKFFKITILLILSLMLSGQAFGQQTGRVIGLENGLIKLNWGSTDGIVKDVLLNVYRVIQIKHPATGEVLGVNEKQIATIVVEESDMQTSLAKILRSTNDIELNDIVKVSFEMGVGADNSGVVEKGVITNVSNNLVSFNMGTNDGIETNLLFDIFRNIAATQHPQTGENIPARNRYIGRLIVTETKQNISTGQLIAFERDILPGDKVFLSRQQAGDIEIDKANTGIQTPIMAQNISRDEISNIQKESISEPSNIVATVTRVDNTDLYFIWRGPYDFQSGRVFGIYRKESLYHPDSGELIGTPHILIGKAKLVETLGELGRALLLSNDADILSSDLVGMMEGETVREGQIITPENSKEIFQSQSSDILNRANVLTGNVRKIQAEMAIVKAALNKLDRIDRELASQKMLTQNLVSSVNEIKAILLGEGISVGGSSIRPSMASIERTESPGSDFNVLRVKYTEGMSVNFEVVDNNILVKLELDSLGRTMLVAEEKPKETISNPDDSLSMTSTDQGGISAEDTSGSGELSLAGEDEAVPFYKDWLWLSLIALVLLGVAGGLYFMFVMKKKTGDKKASSDSDGDDDADDDDFGGDALDEEDEMESSEDAADFLADDDEEEIAALVDDDDD